MFLQQRIGDKFGGSLWHDWQSSTSGLSATRPSHSHPRSALFIFSLLVETRARTQRHPLHTITYHLNLLFVFSHIDCINQDDVCLHNSSSVSLHVGLVACHHCRNWKPSKYGKANTKKFMFGTFNPESIAFYKLRQKRKESSIVFHRRACLSLLCSVTPDNRRVSRCNTPCSL